jgi:hypothetical protein
LARSIVETAISRLHSQGVTRIELMLEADNLRALAFYKKLGFEVEGTMRSAYKRAHEAHYVDEIFMSRLIPSRSEAQHPARAHDAACQDVRVRDALGNDSPYAGPAVWSEGVDVAVLAAAGRDWRYLEPVA